MNETLNNIANRYSCRAYTSELPEKDLLDAIALAAVQSPSGMNRQPWRIHVITDKSLIEELDNEGMQVLAQAADESAYDRIMGRGGRLFYNAPCMFLILKKAGSDTDCGIVSENIALAATSLGLGSVICGLAAVSFGGTNKETLKQRVGFKQDWEFGLAVLVGYAQKEGKPHEADLSKIHYIQ